MLFCPVGITREKILSFGFGFGAFALSCSEGYVVYAEIILRIGASVRCVRCDEEQRIQARVQCHVKLVHGRAVAEQCCAELMLVRSLE